MSHSKGLAAAFTDGPADPDTEPERFYQQAYFLGKSAELVYPPATTAGCSENSIKENELDDQAEQKQRDYRSLRPWLRSSRLLRRTGVWQIWRDGAKTTRYWQPRLSQDGHLREDIADRFDPDVLDGNSSQPETIRMDHFSEQTHMMIHVLRHHGSSKGRVCAAMLLCVLGLAVPARAADAYPLRDAVECHPRAGLPNFRAKIEAGRPVKIAYFGGSITAAPGWRVQSREWFERQYPNARVEEINAAIGGTGSDLGVFRLQNDVLRHRPDLLFVEFAVNDGGAAPEQIHKSLEGIVRQTWRADPVVDICFVYTLSEPVLADLRRGKMQRSATAMEEVAELYLIPSIHFGVKVVELEAAGELVFKAPIPASVNEEKPMVFSTDGVHPHVETGHQLYTAAIARSWPAIRDAGDQPLAHNLGQPLRADNWEQASQVAIAPEMLRGSWQKLDADHTLAKRFQRNMPELHQAREPGAALEFTMEGTTAAIFDLLGPDGGQLKVQLDDREPVLRNRIDGYCTYHRMSKLAVANELPQGRHTVRITLTADTLNKRDILFEHNRPDFDQHPDKYSPHTWYIGSLLVIGKIVPNDGRQE